MIQEKEMLIFLVLLLAAIAALAGWFARIAWEQYKADQEREEQAEKHRQEYEQARCKEYEEQIKQHICDDCMDNNHRKSIEYFM